MKPNLLLYWILIFFASCKPTPQSQSYTSAAQAKPLILCANSPIFSFASFLTHDLAIIQVITPLGKDPAYWTPADADIELLQKADLCLMHHPDYSPWLQQVSLKQKNIHFSTQSFASQWIKTTSANKHTHSNGSTHRHEGIAPTTWINLELAAKQAQAIADRLCILLPEHHTLIQQRSAALFEKLNDAHLRMQHLTQALKNETLLVSHPVYQYWTQAYQLKAIELHWEPDQIPSTSDLQNAQKLIQEHHINTMIWEDTPHPTTVEELQKLGLTLLIVPPYANIKEDWLTELQKNLHNLENQPNIKNKFNKTN
jgi:zinc transport system substrate-binding protein